jgi:RNA polymerase sigma-70 factor, ECF subfamily
MTDRVDDAELVTRAERGEKAAFEELVQRHYEVVVSAAYSILGDVDASKDCAQDAFPKDCAQDAFLEAAATLDKLREKAKFSPWIYGIARRKAIYVLRRQKRHGEAMKVKNDENRAMPAESTPAEQASKNERLESEVLTLKYIDSRSHDDIAQLLDISLAAVDKRLMRGKEMLRESLKRWKSEE